MQQVGCVGEGGGDWDAGCGAEKCVVKWVRPRVFRSWGLVMASPTVGWLVERADFGRIDANHL